MVDVINEFDNRLAEIHKYIDTLVMIENQAFSLRTTGAPFEFDSVFVNSVKGGLLLMAYNLAEYVVVAVLDKIYAEGFSGNEFHAFQDALQAKFLIDFRKAIGDKGKTALISDFIGRYVTDIKSSIVTCGYNSIRRELDFKSVSGNVSEKVLNELSETFGFTLPRKSKHAIPDKLKDFKNYRNTLAHGERSFNDVGKTLSATSIRVDIDLSAAYLRKLIEEISDFIKGKSYLKSP